MKNIYFIVVTVVALMAVTGLSSQVNAEEILGCYNKHHGQLRVVSDHSECLNAEEALILSGSTGSSVDCSLNGIPDLTGTWDFTMEAYCILAGYISSNGTLVIEDQINGVFKGHSIGEEADHTIKIRDISGAIVGNQITINIGNVGVVNATLCGETLAGTVADHNHGDELCTLRVTGQRE
jgi:hypothetical protein